MQEGSTFMDPVGLLRHVSLGSGLSCRSCILTVCIVCLRVRVGVISYESGCVMTRSYDSPANLLSDPERQCSVCMELRLTNLLGASDCVG